MTEGMIQVYGLTRKDGASVRRALKRCCTLAFLPVILSVGFPAVVGAQATDPIPAQVVENPTPQKAQISTKPTVFRVKYVGDGSVYIEAGRNADLQEGMKLSVVEAPPDGAITEGIQYRGYEHVAEIMISSVSDSSAVCDVLKTSGELKIGQAAFLTPESVQSRHQAESASEEDKYPIVVTFTYGDPLDEEVREAREAQENHLTPMQRMRGRLGFSYGSTSETGGLSTRQMGVVVDADMQHLGGTYWNFMGSWRGNMGSSSTPIPGAANQTITDLVNRTYRIGFTYQSPYSAVTLGVGRLFVPWAPSLSTIDGAYFGRKISQELTVGFFGGSTPDPSSWSYNPDQHIAGALVNLEHGSFEHIRIYSTIGIAVTSIQWKVARQFAFFENTWSWKHYMSFYNSMQADAARTSPLPNGGSNTAGISQSYSSLHIQPVKLIGFGANYNFFSTLPTFDPRLLGTGLLDKFLFQGLSGDVRLALPHHFGVFASVGQSKATSDTSKSLNKAYGVSTGNLLKTGVTADVRFTKFQSAFGSGSYESFSLSRSITNNIRVQVYGGHQNFYNFASSNAKGNFLNGVVDWNVGSRYFLEGNFESNRGTSLSYTQWTMVFGYRVGGLRR